MQPNEPNINIKKFKELMLELTARIQKLIAQLNRRYEPVKYAKKHPILSTVVIISSVIIFLYPLLTVWLLACLGTGYPGYRIIQSMIADHEEVNRNNTKQQQISDFMQQSALDQKIIQIPIRHNSRIIQRSVIIRGELEDGISVKDPETGIQSKYMWTSIDLNSLYINYIQPKISE